MKLIFIVSMRFNISFRTNDESRRICLYILRQVVAVGQQIPAESTQLIAS